MTALIASSCAANSRTTFSETTSSISVKARCCVTAIVFAGIASACAPANDDNAVVYSAWAEQRSHVDVAAGGTVARILQIKNAQLGKHEAFLLHLRGSAGRGLTVEVRDDADAVAGAADLATGDGVNVRGEYFYDANGGIVRTVPASNIGSRASVRR